MRNETRLAFDAYCANIATLSGIKDVSKTFSVNPSVQQKMEQRIQQSSGFLQLINMIGVDQQMGSKIGLGAGTPSASTTNTSEKEREPIDLSSMDESGYICTQTDFDTFLTYAKMDAWAHIPNFQLMIRDQNLKNQALARIMIGFNGSSRAANSNRATNPLLQDVNIGWMQKHRTNASARVMSEVGSTGKIQIGDSVDSAHGYKNLDALVYDISNEMLDPWFRQDPTMVVIVGSKLLSDKYFPIINKTQPNSEAIAADMIISQKRIGGLKAISVPYVPEDAVIVTSLDNLSVYYQNGTRRRTIQEQPNRSRAVWFESSNEAYVVEDHGKMAIAENIEIVAA